MLLQFSVENFKSIKNEVDIFEEIVTNWNKY